MDLKQCHEEFLRGLDDRMGADSLRALPASGGGLAALLQYLPIVLQAVTELVEKIRDAHGNPPVA